MTKQNHKWTPKEVDQWFEDHFVDDPLLLAAAKSCLTGGGEGRLSYIEHDPEHAELTIHIALNEA